MQRAMERFLKWHDTQLEHVHISKNCCILIEIIRTMVSVLFGSEYVT